MVHMVAKRGYVMSCDENRFIILLKGHVHKQQKKMRTARTRVFTTFWSLLGCAKHIASCRIFFETVSIEITRHDVK